jgi:hypothetical protein
MRRLRELRASPPELAATSGERREVFSAALEQFEELLDAAARIGPASSSLPLFYALSQAGRAIAAALAVDPWEPHGHGLTVKPDRSALAMTTIAPTQPSDPPRDSFRVVAGAVGSGVLTGAVTLGAVWAALPMLPLRGDLGAGEVRALFLDRGQPGLSIHGILWSLDPEQTLDGDELDSALATRLGRYPLARDGWQVVGRRHRDWPIDRPPGVPHVESGLELRWLTDDGIAKVLELVAPSYPGPVGDNFLVPGVGDDGELLSPVMLWWLLLIALSSVARYEPGLWVKVLDVDSSPVAVAIETAIDMAKQLLPRLVLNELRPAYGG